MVDVDAINPDDARRERNELRAVRDVLRLVEWSNYGDEMCPACGSIKRWGHAADCPLAAALAAGTRP